MGQSGLAALFLMIIFKASNFSYFYQLRKIHLKL